MTGRVQATDQKGHISRCSDNMSDHQYEYTLRAQLEDGAVLFPKLPSRSLLHLGIGYAFGGGDLLARLEFLHRRLRFIVQDSPQ